MAVAEAKVDDATSVHYHSLRIPMKIHQSLARNDFAFNKIKWRIMVRRYLFAITERFVPRTWCDDCKQSHTTWKNTWNISIFVIFFFYGAHFSFLCEVRVLFSPLFAKVMIYVLRVCVRLPYTLLQQFCTQFFLRLLFFIRSHKKCLRNTSNSVVALCPFQHPMTHLVLYTNTLATKERIVLLKA